MLIDEKKVGDIAPQKIPEETRERFKQILAQKEKEKEKEPNHTLKSFSQSTSAMFKHMLSKENFSKPVYGDKGEEVRIPGVVEDIEDRKDIDERDRKDIDKKPIDDKDKKGIGDKERKEIDDKKRIGSKEEGAEITKKEGNLRPTEKVVVQKLRDTIIKGIISFATEARPDVGKSDRATAVNAAMEVISSMAGL